jgi:ribosomal protein S18 acetylase RimI-like enzyme
MEGIDSIGLEVRKYRDGDAPGVRSLWREAFPDEPPHNAPEFIIPQKLAFQPELFFVADAGGKLVGTIMAGYDGHRGWLYTVAVDPGYRRRGVGTALVRRAEAALAALGCTKVNLQVRSSNAAVVRFYERAGYVVEERVSMGRRLCTTGQMDV